MVMIGGASTVRVLSKDVLCAGRNLCVISKQHVRAWWEHRASLSRLWEGRVSMKRHLIGHGYRFRRCVVSAAEQIIPSSIIKSVGERESIMLRSLDLQPIFGRTCLYRPGQRKQQRTSSVLCPFLGVVGWIISSHRVYMYVCVWPVSSEATVWPRVDTLWQLLEENLLWPE